MAYDLTKQIYSKPSLCHFPITKTFRAIGSASPSQCCDGCLCHGFLRKAPRWLQGSIYSSLWSMTLWLLWFSFKSSPYHWEKPFELFAIGFSLPPLCHNIESQNCFSAGFFQLWYFLFPPTIARSQPKFLGKATKLLLCPKPHLSLIKRSDSYLYTSQKYVQQLNLQIPGKSKWLVTVEEVDEIHSKPSTRKSLTMKTFVRRNQTFTDLIDSLKIFI